MTSPRQSLELLRSVWLFEDVEEAELLALIATANRRSVTAGQSVVQRGSADTDLYVILSGHFKVSVPTADGKGIILNVLGPDDIFGELALLDGHPRSASVSCLERGELLVIRRSEFLALLRRSPELSIRLLQKLAGMVRALSTRAEEQAAHGIGERLARRLLDLSDRCGTPIGPNQVALRIRIPQRELGELVQGTRESVNKWLSKWETEGIVYTTRSRIVIRDRARLEAEAQR